MVMRDVSLCSDWFDFLHSPHARLFQIRRLSHGEGNRGSIDGLVCLQLVRCARFNRWNQSGRSILRGLRNFFQDRGDLVCRCLQATRCISENASAQVATTTRAP